MLVVTDHFTKYIPLIIKQLEVLLGTYLRGFWCIMDFPSVFIVIIVIKDKLSVMYLLIIALYRYRGNTY